MDICKRVDETANTVLFWGLFYAVLSAAVVHTEHSIGFLPCDAMLARYMLWPSVCVCLSQVGVLQNS